MQVNSFAPLRNRRWLSAAFLLVAGSVSAAEDRGAVGDSVEKLLHGGLTVEKAVRIALLNNGELRAQLEEVGIAQGELLQAGLLKNPNAEFSVRFPTSGGGHAAELDASVDIMPMLLRSARKRIAEKEVEASRLRSAQALLNAEAEVRGAAYGYLAQRQFLERLRIIGEVNEASADVAQRQFNAGNVNGLELGNLKSSWLENQAEIIRAEAELQSHAEALNQWLGLTGEQTKWSFSGQLPDLPAKERTLDDMEALAVANRPDLAAAKLHWDKTDSALRLRRSTRWLPPSLNVGVHSESEADGGHFTGPMIALEIPLFDHGQGETAKLGAQSRQAQALVDALEVRIRSEARLARASVLAARKNAEHHQNVLLPARKKILADTLLQYNAMQVSNHDLLRAKEQEQRAEQQTIEALRDYWIARAELDRATAARGVSRPAPQGKPDSAVPSAPIPARGSAPAAKEGEHAHQH